jgi:hypothetical protein
MDSIFFVDLYDYSKADLFHHWVDIYDYSKENLIHHWVDLIDYSIIIKIASVMD